jgi:hypothetical protein
MLENFQGNYDDPVTLGHLFAMKKGRNKILRSFVCCFVNVKCQASRLSKCTIINATQEGILHGLLRFRLLRRPPQTVSELTRKWRNARGGG